MHKMLDNSLFSLFLTSFVFHFEKKIQRKKIYKGFLQEKSNKYFLVRLLFFLFSLFSVSPNLTNIRVNFSHNFEFLNFVVLFWKYVIYCKKKSSFYLLHSLHHRAQKIFSLQKGGSRTLVRHCTLQRNRPHPAR